MKDYAIVTIWRVVNRVKREVEEDNIYTHKTRSQKITIKNTKTKMTPNMVLKYYLAFQNSRRIHDRSFEESTYIVFA